MRIINPQEMVIEPKLVVVFCWVHRDLLARWKVFPLRFGVRLKPDLRKQSWGLPISFRPFYRSFKTLLNLCLVLNESMLPCKVYPKLDNS